MFRILPPLAVASLTIFATVRPANAEIIELIDKTKMSAKIIHFYDGVYSVESQGSTVKVPKEKIKSITFQMPAPRAEFSTPRRLSSAGASPSPKETSRRSSTATRSCSRACLPCRLAR